MASDERKHFSLVRAKNYDDSIAVLRKYLNGEVIIDDEQKGWLYQLCARAAYFWENIELSDDFQKKAYSLNNNLMKPRADLGYLSSFRSGKQSTMIVEPIKEFRERRGYFSEFRESVSWLNPSATTNQFEESLKDLGSILGFHSERPDHSLGKGPDVLWIVDERMGFVIEAKSNKGRESTFNKDDDSQMITSFDWFVQKYPTHQGVKIVVQPNNFASSAISTGDLYALTLDNLNALISNTTTLINELTNSSVSDEKLIAICERRIDELHLTPEGIANWFLRRFETK